MLKTNPRETSVKWFSPHFPRTDGGCDSSAAPWALPARPARPVLERLSVGDTHLTAEGL